MCFAKHWVWHQTGLAFDGAYPVVLKQIGVKMVDEQKLMDERMESVTDYFILIRCAKKIWI